MVKIELMRIEPGDLLSRSSDQTLFKRMSSRSLFPRTSLSSLPSPTPTLSPTLPTNSVVSSSFTALRNPYRGYKVLGRRGVLSGGRSPDRHSRNKKDSASEEQVSRLSLPCVHGCCYCVYGRLLGPVRVYISNYTPEKNERKIRGIKDGNGKKVFPVSRKQDIKGLVYDHDTFSLHPPLVSTQPIPRSHKPPRYRHVTRSASTLSGYKRIWSSQSRMPNGLR